MRIQRVFISLITISSLLFTSAAFAKPINETAPQSVTEQTAFPSITSSVSTDIIGGIARVREEESLRTTNSETYLLSDGTYECVVYAEDKYYQDESNTLKRIDNCLIPAETNSRRDITSYKNAANVFDVQLSSENTPEISITYHDYSLSFSPVVSTFQGSAGLTAQKSTLSVGRVQNCGVLEQLTATGDNTATYTNAFQNTDLIYVLDNSMLKEYIVLKSATSPNSFSFLFQFDGLSLDTSGRNPCFVDAQGNVVFALADLFAVDGNGKPTDALTYTVQPASNRGEVYITVTLDQAFLSAQERTFPIIIDPTTVISSVQTADACVCSAFPNTNYYTNIYLRTGKDVDYGVRRSYIKFLPPVFASGTTFITATLDLEMRAGVTPNLYAYRCADSWSSSSITWNNKPGYYVNEVSTKALHRGDGWYSMMVTNIVTGWLDGSYSNYGFVLKDAIESDEDHWTTYYSSDSSEEHLPELHIRYSCDLMNIPFEEYLYNIRSDLKYFCATGTSSFSALYEVNEKNGMDLWRFEEYSPGIYRIESLGVRNTLYAGRYRNFLTVLSSDGTSANSTLTLNAYASSNNAQLWKVYGAGLEQCYLVNYAYPQIALGLDGSTPTLVPVDSAALWNLTPKTFENYDAAGSYQGASAPYVINIVIDSSAINGYWDEDIFECYTAWNGINNQINLRLYPHDYTGSYATADFTVKVFGRNLDADGGVFARTYRSFYTNNSSNYYTDIHIVLSTGSVYGLNSSSYSDTDREKTFLHEVGHALLLLHPHEIDTSWRPVSIMCQGAPSKTANVPSRPSGYDIYNFTRKW